jgi:hypothetical protein
MPDNRNGVIRKKADILGSTKSNNILVSNRKGVNRYTNGRIGSELYQNTRVKPVAERTKSKPVTKKDVIEETEKRLKKESEWRVVRKKADTDRKDSFLLYGNNHKTEEIGVNNTSGSGLLGLKYEDSSDKSLKRYENTKETTIETKSISDNKSRGSLLLYGSKKGDKSYKGKKSSNIKNNSKEKRRNNNKPTQKAVIKAKALTDLSRSIATSSEDPNEAVKSFGVTTGKKAVRKVIRTIMLLIMKVIMTAISLLTKLILALLPAIIFALLPVIIVIVLVSSIINLFSGGSSDSVRRPEIKTEYLSEDPLINDVLNYAKVLCDDDRHGYTLDTTMQGQCTGIYDYDRTDLCCAQFVSICYHNCGANLPVTAGATTLTRYLEANDDFIEVTSLVNLDTEEGLVPGDIFIVAYNTPGDYDHTEIYYAKGQSAGAHNDRGKAGRSPRPGDQSDEVSLCGYYYNNPQYAEVRFFRYIGTTKNNTSESTSEMGSEESSTEAETE